jgi:hypothetical protein
MTAPPRDWAAYVFYVNRPDLLRRSLECFPDLWDDTTIVDNSAEGLPILDLTWPAARPPHTQFPRQWRPPVPLHYSQSVNWMLADALRKRRRLIVHFHADALSAHPDAVAQLLARARADLAASHRVCCWYTFHDILWAINTAALADIGGCDTRFHDYFCDGDLRVRWERAGWVRAQADVSGITHEGSATINSDPRRGWENGHTFPHYSALFKAKFGGEPGRETFSHPYGDARMDWRPVEAAPARKDDGDDC